MVIELLNDRIELVCPYCGHSGDEMTLTMRIGLGDLSGPSAVNYLNPKQAVCKVSDVGGCGAQFEYRVGFRVETKIETKLLSPGRDLSELVMYLRGENSRLRSLLIKTKEDLDLAKRLLGGDEED